MLQVVAETTCIAAVGSIVCGFCRRRSLVWVTNGVLLDVAQRWPTGHALSHVARFMVTDFVMPRDRTTRSRGAPSLCVGVVVYLLSASEALAVFRFDRAANLAGVLYVDIMILGLPLVEKRMATFTESDAVLFGGFALARALKS